MRFSKKFVLRDEEVVEDFAKLLSKTEHREQVISGITEKLQEELGSLADFLDNLALRRPPGKWYLTRGIKLWYGVCLSFRSACRFVDA